MLVSDDFEYQRAHRFVRRGMSHLGFIALLWAGMCSLDWRAIQRAGQVVLDPVEHRLDADVVQCGAAEDGLDVP